MYYRVKTDNETIYSVTLKYYGNIDMLEQVVISNPHLQATFLKAEDSVYLPKKLNNTKKREKIY